MLSVKVLTRADISEVAQYYSDGADDYYAKEGESQQWQGKGAEQLGLVGEVERERFRELLAGKVEVGGPGVRQTVRDDAKARIGIDLTFSAPKSVSIMALVGGDAALIHAHDEAVRRALEQVEALAQAREKRAGKTRVENTGNIVVAKFRHETNREAEPTLHTHGIVMNLTRRSDGSWRALHNDAIIKSTMYLGAFYRSELAHILAEKGYELRHGRDGMFELANVTRDQIERFSTRSAAIEARLAEEGLDRDTATSAQKQRATMQTRKKKDPTADREKLHQTWRDIALESGINLGERPEPGEGASEGAAAVAEDLTNGAKRAAALRALDYAINHLTERDAIMTHRTMIDTALKHSMGTARMAELEDEVARRVLAGSLVAETAMYYPAGEMPEAAKTESAWAADLVAKGASRDQASRYVAHAIDRGGLVPAEVRFTTKRGLEREIRILTIERNGRGAVAPVLSAAAAVAHFERQPLNEGQRGAAAMILSTANRVVGIEGFAGVGKSHLLKYAQAALEDHKLDVQALAPYGSQVKALRELGTSARTVAAFLRAEDKKIGPNTVLFIDEAGVLPARQMAQVMQVAEAAGARVVFVGDRGQTQAIEAGRPFDQLIRAGMELARVEEIQRQNPNPKLKEAVKAAAHGRPGAALRLLEDVREVSDAERRHAQIASAYVSLPKGERDRTIIVSGTNAARRQINENVRAGLGLAGEGIKYAVLLRRDTTQEERRHARNYHIGDSVQPERDYEKIGLKRGELYRVVDNGPGNRLTVRAPDGELLDFSPMHQSRLSVYQTAEAELSAGDLVRITRNDKNQDVANGDRFAVSHVDESAITLSDGKRTVRLDATKPLHVDHAYVTTAHSSQGLTADRAIVDFVSESRTTSRNTFYVAISRARHAVTVFTNNLEALPVGVTRHMEKNAAMDLVRDLGARSGFSRGVYEPAPREYARNTPQPAMPPLTPSKGPDTSAKSVGPGT